MTCQTWRQPGKRLAGSTQAASCFVETLALVDIQVAYVLVLGLARGERTQCRAAEESHLAGHCVHSDSVVKHQFHHLVVPGVSYGQK
jgi:hypothetical protein